jgi:hypothetical protein
MFKLLLHKTKTPEQIQATVDAIHEDFMTASDKAVAQAKALLEQNKEVLDKASRLKQLGFTSTQTVKIAEGIKGHKAISKDIAKAIRLYQEHYPNCKFITEDDVRAICKKYALLCGPVSAFIGSVPEKNIAQMEAFKLKNEHIVYNVIISSVRFSSSAKESLRSAVRRVLKENNNSFMVSINDSNRYDSKELLRNAVNKSGTQEAYNINSVESNTIQPGLSICAPATDFSLEGKQVKDSFLQSPSSVSFATDPVPDPVVLQRVKEGYLIITAWGPEASDPLVMNERHN